MALKLVVDAIDDVDEAIRPLYAEKDGKFFLQVDGLEDTDGIKKALKSANKEAEQERLKRKRWEALGKSPEEIEEMIEAARVAAERKEAEAGNWDKLRGQLNEKHQGELSKKDEQIAGMRSTLERYLIDAAATAAIAAAKGVPDLLLPHVQRSTRVVEENGEFSVKVVDAKGDPRINGKGEPLTIADLVAEMKASDIFGRAFEASGQSGSGMPPARPNGGGSGVAQRRSDFKSEKERAEFVNTHGLAAYQALPA